MHMEPMKFLDIITPEEAATLVSESQLWGVRVSSGEWVVTASSGGWVVRTSQSGE